MEVKKKDNPSNVVENTVLSITFNEDVGVIVWSDCSGTGMAAVAMTMTTSQCFGSLRDDRLCAFNWTNQLVPSFASCISYPILSYPAYYLQ